MTTSLNFIEVQRAARYEYHRAQAICYGSLIAVAGLQVIDVVSTQQIMNLPGGVELNPMVALLMTLLGSAWWVVKLALVGCVIGFVAYARATRTAGALLGISALVVANNLSILL